MKFEWDVRPDPDYGGVVFWLYPEGKPTDEEPEKYHHACGLPFEEVSGFAKALIEAAQ